MKTKRASIVVLGVATSAFLIWAGWVYGKFPVNWYRPVEFGQWFLITLMTLVPGGFLGIPCLVVFVLSAIRFRSLRGKAESSLQPLLFLPLLPLAFASAFGAYWALQPSKNAVLNICMGRPECDRWALEILQPISHLFWLLWLVVALYFCFSKSLTGRRKVLLFAILGEAIYAFFLLFTATMEVSNVWL